jgi:sporulation protein YlmC with PRC-barrel domain
MLKPIAIAALMATFGSGAAYAQTTTPAHPPASMNDTSRAPADASTLIGRNVQNMQNETIGEIKSIYLGIDGKVDSVIVGVGGFLGMAEREVKLAWHDLKISDGGKKVTVDMTKDRLKAEKPYAYSDMKYRGTVFSDAGVRAAADARATTDGAVSANRVANERTVDTGRTTSTGDFNAHGDMAASALIGTRVHNDANDTMGKVEDLYVDANGAIKTVVVSVGGFLGMGGKNVAVNWSELKYGRDGDSVVLKTSWTKDSLKSMPDYKYERRQPAEQAAAPPVSK